MAEYREKISYGNAIKDMAMIGGGFIVSGFTGRYVEEAVKPGVSSSDSSVDKVIAAAANNAPKFGLYYLFNKLHMTGAASAAAGSIGYDLLIRLTNQGVEPYRVDINQHRVLSQQQLNQLNQLSEQEMEIEGLPGRAPIPPGYRGYMRRPVNIMESRPINMMPGKPKPQGYIEARKSFDEYGAKGPYSGMSDETYAMPQAVPDHHQYGPRGYQAPWAHPFGSPGPYAGGPFTREAYSYRQVGNVNAMPGQTAAEIHGIIPQSSILPPETHMTRMTRQTQYGQMGNDRAGSLMYQTYGMR